jgi:hypothetical protein
MDIQKFTFPSSPGEAHKQYRRTLARPAAHIGGDEQLRRDAHVSIIPEGATRRLAFFVFLPLLFLTACVDLGRSMTASLRPGTSTPRHANRAYSVPVTPTSETPCRTHTCNPQIFTLSPTPSVCIVDTGLHGDGWLNIRARPTVQSAILVTVPDGTALAIIHPGTWSQVRFGDLTGWVNTTYCTYCTEKEP